MSFFILLIIGLLIILTTYFSKIKNKRWLLFIFLIYLIFLLFTWYDSIHYLHWYSFVWISDFRNLKDYSVAFLVFFSIFYIILYFIGFIYFNRKLGYKKIIYFLIRDFFILFWVYLFYFFYNNIMWIYVHYYDRYKNPTNFNHETYKCENTSVKLLLEHTYKYRPIVNKYDNFYDFYKKYWKWSKWISTNQLNIKLLNNDFLSTCVNQKWENYYDKYIEIHWIEPLLKKDKYYREDLKYDYFLSDEEVEIILNNLNLN